MSEYYDAGSFWQETLSSRFDLTGVGHGGYGPRYNAVLYRAKLRAFERALSAASLTCAGRSIVDVGCGVGVFTREATARHCSRYVGIDITPVAVQRLGEQFPQHELHVADVGAELPALGEFELVLCFDVLYHIVDPARYARAVENLASMIAPGGHLLLVDAFWKEDVVPGGTLERAGADIPHVVFHGRPDYDRLLFERADLELVSLTPMYWMLNRPIRRTSWPWTSRRVSWQLRHRLFEARAVLRTLYALDGLVTRVRNEGPELKIAVVRKRA